MTTVKKKYIFLICSFLLLVMYSSCRGCDDKVSIRLRSSKEGIKSSLLQCTPIGSSANDVLFFTRNKLRYKKRLEPVYNETRGVFVQLPGEKGQFIGRKSVDVEIGSYFADSIKYFLFRTHVIARWAFDENDKLLDIIVFKETDGL
ncbi:MAG: hypothetical protein V1685_00340 [Parcubacteria group bacterium]